MDLINILNRAKIAAGSRKFSLIAVSKTQPVEKILALYREGQRDFGENYAQELEQKAQAFTEMEIRDIRWHFLGHLQSNKIKKVLPYVYAIHSIDSLSLANKLEAQVNELNPSSPLPIFIEVNVDQQQSKTGISIEELPQLCLKISKLKGLKLMGIMGMPDPNGDTRESFKRLFAANQSVKELTHGELSMGMSADFEVALQEGSTYIRIGTALFGPRP